MLSTKAEISTDPQSRTLKMTKTLPAETWKMTSLIAVMTPATSSQFIGLDGQKI
jgi:hypothetical protein